jgi:hypothetical protein
LSEALCGAGASFGKKKNPPSVFYRNQNRQLGKTTLLEAKSSVIQSTDSSAGAAKR